MATYTNGNCTLDEVPWGETLAMRSLENITNNPDFEIKNRRNVCSLKPCSKNVRSRDTSAAARFGWTVWLKHLSKTD